METNEPEVIEVGAGLFGIGQMSDCHPPDDSPASDQETALLGNPVEDEGSNCD